MNESKRLVSLDVYRGFTVAAMIIANDAGDYKHVFEQLRHASWHGWTFTDTIFPSFMWIVGVSTALSFAKRLEKGDNKVALLKHIWVRAAALVLIAWAMALIPKFDFAHLRYLGVLPRIGISYGVAATFFVFFNTRQRIWITSALMAIYAAFMLFYPVPGFGAGILQVPGNFSWYIDGLLLQDHMWSGTKTWDPEGIISTLPAIGSVMLGLFAGEWLRSSKPITEKLVRLFFSGALLLLGGMLVSTWLPINKPIWTPSFALFMAGISSISLACTIWLVDVHGWQRYTRVFEAFGRNALILYVCAGFLAKWLGIMRLHSPLYSACCRWIYPPELASFTWALLFTGFHAVLAWIMYKRNWIVRL
jgi:predicted acyltransferase